MLERFTAWPTTMTSIPRPELLDTHLLVRRLLDLIGGKWTPVVLYYLAGGVGHFNEMQRQIPDISKKMLAQVLHDLEEHGLVERIVYPVVPPKTEYRLTDKGRRLHELIVELCNWARANEKFLDEIQPR